MHLDRNRSRGLPFTQLPRNRPELCSSKDLGVLFPRFYQLGHNGFCLQMNQSCFLTLSLSHTMSPHNLSPFAVHLPSCPEQGSQQTLQREHTTATLPGATTPGLCVRRAVPRQQPQRGAEAHQGS